MSGVLYLPGTPPPGPFDVQHLVLVLYRVHTTGALGEVKYVLTGGNGTGRPGSGALEGVLTTGDDMAVL
jgi:hypothetical protein